MAHSLPRKFKAAGITCGIKDSGKPDLSLFVSEVPASVAGVFTTNRVVGAPVIVDRERVPADDARGIIINSGNANACTGDQGLSNARRMTHEVAQAIHCDERQVLVCSTGIIGVQLPMDVISAGIPRLAETLSDSDEAYAAAAQAMMTTDTFSKQATETVDTAGGPIRIAGVAKGAAMIGPNMATMLCVLMTDAKLTPPQCDRILRYSVDRSFNCISVEGHESTSDSVLFFANGAAGTDDPTDDALQSIQEALARVCEQLATDIIRDAEGAEHFVTLDVTGFATRQEAARIAKAVCESALVKTAIAGNDPNWGRITSAAGYAGVDFDVTYLTLSINETEVFRAGTPVEFDEAALSEQMRSNPEVHLKLHLSDGPASGTESVRFWTSDLTQEYVRLNSEYTT